MTTPHPDLGRRVERNTNDIEAIYEILAQHGEKARPDPRRARHQGSTATARGSTATARSSTSTRLSWRSTP
ncbi:hypothetical protein G5V59_05330 [Nocardioides sp. W3-2-3]|nr:hypothetical protein [Nocardioides convexus]